MSTTEFQEGWIYNGEFLPLKSDGITALLKAALYIVADNLLDFFNKVSVSLGDI
jgi:hypothetical protein